MSGNILDANITSIDIQAVTPKRGGGTSAPRSYTTVYKFKHVFFAYQNSLRGTTIEATLILQFYNSVLKDL